MSLRNRTRWFLCMVVLALGWVLVLASADTEEGKRVYDRRCKMCHAADGKGNPSIARMLKVELPELDSEEVRRLTDDELEMIITKGKGKMAAVKNISAEEVARVIAYLRSLGESAEKQ